LLVGVAAVWYQITVGIGTWGLNSTVGWAFDITNFVFWVGIGHAGTLISAILLLFRQSWRNSVNRSAEAMTIFAVMCAGLFPLIHMGRPWLFFWVLPYPNTRGSLWINFRSPLVWDFFAIGTYFTVSLVFWYVGLIPDLATLRDRTTRPVRRHLYQFFALGWNGSGRVWHQYEMLYLLLAGLATPLVLSVHTVVSWDFGVSVIPGWHSTIFPPYFVAGAIFSGLAMVLTLLLVARRVMRFERYITARHVNAICSLIIVTSGIIGLSYAIEVFVGFYSANHYERFAVVNRAAGPLAWAYWLMVGCNVVVPQLLWSGAVRRNLVVVFIISILINIGMWFERFVIIVGSLERSYLVSSWADYAPTIVEVCTLVGSFGLFFTCFLLFARFIPMISIADVKTLVGDLHVDGDGK
jgi:molybdopterin-containing oxidoreductase family membrane subunit